MKNIDCLRGIVTKFEPSNSHHRRFFSLVDTPECLATTFNRSSWIANNPQGLDGVLSPHQKIVVTTTEEDKFIAKRDVDDEIKRLVKGLFDIYIPSDQPVYEDMDDRKQFRRIDRCMRDTLEVADGAESLGLETKIVPLAKGWKRWHFELCRHTFEKLGTSCCAFDVTQYNSMNQILEDLDLLIETVRLPSILLIGRLSPRDLKRCPPEVIAAAGFTNWFYNSRLPNGSLSPTFFREWHRSAERALLSSQMRLEQFGLQ